MELSALSAHCRAKPGATQDRPFGPEPLVLKVGGRIFAIIAEPPTISLKCEPELAVVLRDTHGAVTPGYHLNKRHWNTVRLDGSIAEDEIRAWIDDSYDLVVEGLPRRVAAALQDSGHAQQ